MRSFSASWTTAFPIPLGRPAWHCSLSPAGRELWTSYSLSEWPSRVMSVRQCLCVQTLASLHLIVTQQVLSPFVQLQFPSPLPLLSLRSRELEGDLGSKWDKGTEKRSGAGAILLPQHLPSLSRSQLCQVGGTTSEDTRF